MSFWAQMPKYGNLGLDPLRMMIFHQVMIFFPIFPILGTLWGGVFIQAWPFIWAFTVLVFTYNSPFSTRKFSFFLGAFVTMFSYLSDKIKELCHHWDKKHYVPVWGVWVLEALGMVREETFHWPFVGIFWDFKCEDCYMFSPDKDNDVVKNIIRRISLFKKYINLL